MTPEEELLENIRRDHSIDEVKVEPSSVNYFRELQRRFPVCGSKIDWAHVLGAQTRRIETIDSEAYFEQAEAFASKLWSAEKLDPDRLVVVIGDSAMEVALKMPLRVLQTCLRSVLKMPQHTYVLAQDASWCTVFTMEGDVSFGYAPQ